MIPDKNPSYSTSLFVQPAGSVAEPWWMTVRGGRLGDEGTSQTQAIQSIANIMVKPEPEGNNRLWENPRSSIPPPAPSSL